MRCKLIILSKEEYILLITFHHIISDGWSMNIFFKELSTFYNSYILGEVPSLPTLPIQYADFAIWQREWLKGDVLQGQLNYWRKQLEGMPEALTLPIDQPRPKELSYRGSIYSYHISKEIMEGLNKFCQDQQVSLFVVLLTSFQVLLYCYTNQEEIIVGSPKKTTAKRHVAKKVSKKKVAAKKKPVKSKKPVIKATTKRTKAKPKAKSKSRSVGLNIV